MVSSRTLSPTVLFARRAGLVLAGSLVMVLSAQVSVPASPIWGVPITLQTLAIPVLVALLGRNLGTLAVLAYLLEGLAGLPVFAQHLGGPLPFFGPTGGYLIAFPAAAYATGLLYERWSGTYPQRFAAVFLGTAVVFVGGAGWLAVAFTHDLGKAVAAGVLPFLVGDVAKCLIAAGVRPRKNG